MTRNPRIWQSEITCRNAAHDAEVTNIMSFHAVFMIWPLTRCHLKYLNEVLGRIWVQFEPNLLSNFQNRVLNELQAYEMSRQDLKILVGLLAKCAPVVDLITVHSV